MLSLEMDELVVSSNLCFNQLTLCVNAGVVKVRRGQAAKYLVGLGTIDQVYTALHHLAHQLTHK